MRTHYVNCQTLKDKIHALGLLYAFGYRDEETLAKAVEAYDRGEYHWIDFNPQNNKEGLNGFASTPPSNRKEVKKEELFDILSCGANRHKEIELNEEHTAIVYKDKIVVGCQTFPVDIVDKLQKALEELS